MPRWFSLLRVVWTFLAVGSSLPILAYTVGSAAWNGVNWVVWLYLIASAGGSIGLLAGFCSAFSRSTGLKWITCVAALAVVLVSAIYAAGFTFGRTAGMPLNDPMYFGSFHAPILLLYANAVLCCLAEAMLYFPAIEIWKQADWWDGVRSRRASQTRSGNALPRA
jgi:hypothetical protein